MDNSQSVLSRSLEVHVVESIAAQRNELHPARCELADHLG
jgi:hypothetical protein